MKRQNPWLSCLPHTNGEIKFVLPRKFLFIVLLRPLVVKYQVLVRTGKLTGADTDANVYVVLYGERGDTGRRRLVYSDNPVKFQEDQVGSPVGIFEARSCSNVIYYSTF